MNKGVNYSTAAPLAFIVTLKSVNIWYRLEAQKSSWKRVDEGKNQPFFSLFHFLAKCWSFVLPNLKEVQDRRRPHPPT